MTALAYVDLSPPRAHIVGQAGHYPWSSAATHLSGRDSGGSTNLDLGREIPSAIHWADALDIPPAEQDTEHLRQATLGGLRLGESEFIEDLEHTFVRRLSPARPGRMPNSTVVAA
jgi:putative transposase